MRLYIPAPTLYHRLNRIFVRNLSRHQGESIYNLPKKAEHTVNMYISMSSPIAWEQSWKEPWLDLGLENHHSCCILDIKELGIKEKWKSGDNN